jgi:hypothetical protein
MHRPASGAAVGDERARVFAIGERPISIKRVTVPWWASAPLDGGGLHALPAEDADRLASILAVGSA